jgi:hypothetical protein
MDSLPTRITVCCAMQGSFVWLECHDVYGAARHAEICVALSDLSRRRRARERTAKQEDVIDRPEDINSSSSCRFFG